MGPAIAILPESQHETRSLQAAQREIEPRAKLMKLTTDISGNISWTEWEIWEEVGDGWRLGVLALTLNS